MIRAVVAAVVVLMFSATTALSFQAAGTVEVAIDVITTGNTASSLGAQDACTSVNVGDSFDIDITVKGVPPVLDSQAGLGLAGYSYNLHFDPAVINVTATQNNLMINSSAPFDRIEANFTPSGGPNPLPATTGNMRVDFADISVEYEDGDGVISRLTVTAVGSGATTLHLQEDVENQPSPAIWMAGGFPYRVNPLHDAVISVGSPCDSSTAPSPYDPEDTWQEIYNIVTPAPTPTPVPTPTPTLGPSDAPEGDTTVSVDAITIGNTATSVAQIDDCASADVGDRFSVDIVIENVDDLLGFELPVSYDPRVLNVVDRDVKLFLASNAGSQVFDASNQTPNNTGFYRAGGVDQADPATPDSGSGVLMRLTMEAVAEGRSEISISAVDLNSDGENDTGVLLKNVDNLAIGGPLFRGPITNAEVRVGSDCEGGGQVIATAGPSGTGRPTEKPVDGDDGGSNSWIFIVIGVVAAVVAGGAGTAVYLRRRAGGGTPPAEPPAA